MPYAQKTHIILLRAFYILSIKFMGRPGFEPGTNRLKAEYSTVELATRLTAFPVL